MLDAVYDASNTLSFLSASILTMIIPLVFREIAWQIPTSLQAIYRLMGLYRLSTPQFEATCQWTPPEEHASVETWRNQPTFP